KISGLSVTGSNIQWYTTAVGGSTIDTSTLVTDGSTYYASQTIAGCESLSRLAIKIQVNTTPAAPTGIAVQTFCSETSPTVSNLAETGSNLLWYDAARGGSIVPDSSPLTNGTAYFAS